MWTLGTYYIYYGVTDQSGNSPDDLTRTVIVQDTTDPVLTVGYGMSYGDEADAYYKNGLVTGYTIRPWMVVVGAN